MILSYYVKINECLKIVADYFEDNFFLCFHQLYCSYKWIPRLTGFIDVPLQSCHQPIA